MRKALQSLLSSQSSEYSFPSNEYALLAFFFALKLDNRLGPELVEAAKMNIFHQELRAHFYNHE